MFINTTKVANAVSILNEIAKQFEGTNEVTEREKQLREVILEVKNLLTPFELPAFDASIDVAISEYVKMRDMLNDERRDWEEHERVVKDHMERISMWLTAKGDELGVDSFSTSAGTAYRSVKEQYRIENWDEYAKWLLETGNINCLEKRPAKLAVKEVIEDTGQVPPGLTVHTEVEFLVRRPTNRKKDQ